MKLSKWMFAACASLALAACGGSDKPGSNGAGGTVPGTFYGDVVYGSKDAPAVLREYASPTCGHCAHFHEDVIIPLMARVEAGELRIESREFLIQPTSIAAASFQVARCAGEDKYHDVLTDIYANQRGILIAAQSGSAPAALMTIGKRHGLSEAEFNVCVRDEKLFEVIVASHEEGQDRGVDSTPTIFFNGELFERSVDELDRLNAMIDEANGIAPTVEAADAEAPVTEETVADAPAETTEE